MQATIYVFLHFNENIFCIKRRIIAFVPIFFTLKEDVVKNEPYFTII